ncbi:hypothetical protein PanWU01x14_227510, partial [Parasponia andersonii]
IPPKGGAIGATGNLKCIMSSFEVQETNVSGQLESLAW